MYVRFHWAILRFFGLFLLFLGYSTITITVIISIIIMIIIFFGQFFFLNRVSLEVRGVGHWVSL